MNDIQARLTRCFAAVFPQVPEVRIRFITQESTEGWDSVITATLLTVIEEEFAIVIDSEDLERLDSFERIQEYLSRLEK